MILDSPISVIFSPETQLFTTTLLESLEFETVNFPSDKHCPLTKNGRCRSADKIFHRNCDNGPAAEE